MLTVSREKCPKFSLRDAQRSVVAKVSADHWELLLLQLITARVRSMREGNVLTRICVSVHTCGGKGTPSQVWGRGVPHLPPTMTGWGTHPIDLGWGTPDLRWGTPPEMEQGTPPEMEQGTHPTWDGVPPYLRWGTFWPEMGYPQTWGGVPPPQHSEHLLHGGWYASCVHAGGLSCWNWIIGTE